MEKENQIIKLAKEVLNIDELTLESSPETVESWDSLSHAQLIDKIEKEFKLKIDLLEMLDINSLQDILNLVESKTS